MLIEIVADWEGERRRVYRRLPHWRACHSCGERFVIAHIFGLSTHRYRLMHYGRETHMVLDNGPEGLHPLLGVYQRVRPPLMRIPREQWQDCKRW